MLSDELFEIHRLHVFPFQFAALSSKSLWHSLLAGEAKHVLNSSFKVLH